MLTWVIRAVDRAGGCVGTGGGGMYIPCAAIVELIDVEPRARAAAAVSRKFNKFEKGHPRWPYYAVPSLNIAHFHKAMG
eukprot:SAG22_NODE_11_length_35583_cov_107.128790_31_plen_79_part_00